VSELVTVPRLRQEIAWAAERLAGAGLPQPRQEALALWACVSGSTAGDAWLRADEGIDQALGARFREAVERRAAGEPRAYAAGRAGFRTLDLLVDRRVLIPRPETEGLVELVLQEARARWPAAGPPGGGPGVASEGPSVLDLGTGSGCIALSLAVEGRFGRIVATDLSPEALEVARANLERLEPPPRLELRLGSWFEPVSGEQFDVIVSNPPYVAEGEYAELDAGVRDFEPRLALVSGADGLEATRAILAGAHAHVRAGGLLALEVDSRRAAESAKVARIAGWPAVRLERDLFGRPRYLLVTKECA